MERFYHFLMMQLNIRVVEARDMPKEDIIGRCDPFVELHVGSTILKTRVCKQTYNPIWNETFTIPLPSPYTTIFLRFVDYDSFTPNDPFATLQLNSGSFPIGQVIDNWYYLMPLKHHKRTGQVHLIIQVAPQGHPPFQPMQGVPPQYPQIIPQQQGYYPQPGMYQQPGYYPQQQCYSPYPCAYPVGNNYSDKYQYKMHKKAMKKAKKMQKKIAKKLHF